MGKSHALAPGRSSSGTRWWTVCGRWASGKPAKNPSCGSCRRCLGLPRKASTRGRSSRSKGARGEREFAEVLTELTGDDWERSIGQTRRGGGEVPDVVAPGSRWEGWLHVEVKRTGKRPNVHKAMEQAVGDAGDQLTPVVGSRKDHGEWLLTVRLVDVVDLPTLLECLRGRHER